MSRSPSEMGWVYLIWDEKEEAVKIGWTTDFESRLKWLQTSTSEDYEVLEVFRGTRRLEKALHAKFKEIHKKREWFHDDPALFFFLDGLEALRREAVDQARQRGEVTLETFARFFANVVVPEELIIGIPVPPPISGAPYDSER